MKEKSIFILCMLVSCFHIFCEKSSIVEEKNDYGGRTVLVTYGKEDSNSEIIESSRIYYDKNSKLIKSVSKIVSTKSKEVGIAFQEQQYDNDRLVYYKMYTTDAEKLKRGYDYIVEFVEPDDSINICGYGFGDILIKEQTGTFSYKYPFFSLSYLFSQIYEEPYSPNQKGDEITYSVKYNKGRALVIFSGSIMPLTNKDKSIINYYFDTNNIKGGDVYNNKIMATENGKQYTVFVQDGLLPYCMINKKALISFAAIGYNHAVYPLLTSMIDVD